MGITTSMSCASGMRRIFSASAPPMFRRASYTDVPSITESGRARYTNSKMHGLSEGLSAHWRAWNLPVVSTKIASPGATSRST